MGKGRGGEEGTDGFDVFAFGGLFGHFVTLLGRCQGEGG